MKLGKLLAAGKSIMNGRANISYRDISYRAGKQFYLPKFGPAKNPFKPELEKKAEEIAPPALETGKPAVVATPRPTRAASPEMPAAPVVASAANPAATRIPARPATTVIPQSNWANKFNPALIFRRGSSNGQEKPAAKAAIAAGAQRPAVTQAELTLDSVKVVHNDLSDVDVEIVPIKSRAAAPEMEAPKKSWEYLGERLFGVEAT